MKQFWDNFVLNGSVESYLAYRLHLNEDAADGERGSRGGDIQGQRPGNKGIRGRGKG